MKLTERIIQNAKLPTAGAKLMTPFLWDSKCQGLAVRVLPSGTKTFVLQMRHDGRLHRVKIGRYSSSGSGWTLEQARRRADELRVKIQHGEEVNDKATFEALAELFFQHSVKRKTVARMRKRLDEHCSGWLKRKAKTITKGEIGELYDKIGANYPSLANRVVALVHAIFAYAIRKEKFKGANPAVIDKEDRLKEKKRERYLSFQELERLNDAILQEVDWRHRSYFPLLLLTGARKGELLRARWEHIKFDECTWEKPDTKTGVPQTMPLPQAAIQILEALPSRSKSEWIFPGYGETGHMRDAFEAWVRIRDRAKIHNLRQHDLRHSFASFLAGRGVSIQVIGRLLNHKSIQTTQRYAHIADEAQRAAIEANAALMITGQ